MQRPRSDEGPPMYWYGWLALSFSGAAVIGWRDAGVEGMGPTGDHVLAAPDSRPNAAEFNGPHG
jgi:hypothetical protein